MKSIGQLNRMISVSNELIEASKGLLALGVVTAKVHVSKINEELWHLLQVTGENKKKYDLNKIEEIPQIQALRDTYKTLGLKVSEYKGSNEALLRRIVTDKGLYQINTVVDVNNYISVDSLRSVGSYDLSQLSGNIEFRKGKTGEKYTGTTNRSVMLKNLPVLCDDNGPFGSPTSDSSRALIKDTTTDIMTVIFSFDGKEGLEEQLLKISDLLKVYADASNINIHFVKNSPVELVFAQEEIDEVLKKQVEIQKEEEMKKIFDEKSFNASIKRFTKDLLGYKVIEGDTKKISIEFNNLLTGEMHGDVRQLQAIEQVVNLLKQRSIIKDEAIEVEGDESLGFAYNGVKLNNKPEEHDKGTEINKASLHLKLCHDHFELFFNSPEQNSKIEMVAEIIGQLFVYDDC